MVELGVKELIPFFEEFYTGYFHDYLLEKNKVLPLDISAETCLEKDLDFDWEAYDYFLGELGERYKVDVSGYYINVHTKGMSYELSLLPTKLLLPLIGLKKWMVFKEDSRVPLTIGDLVNALNSKKLSSVEIFREAKRNEYQEKTYQILKKATH